MKGSEVVAAAVVSEPTILPPSSTAKNSSRVEKKASSSFLQSFAQDLAAGGLASVLSKTAMAPVERVKLLLQVQWVHADIPPERRYSGVLDCARRVYREQGFLSFWRGNAVNVVRYIPSQALNFSLRDRFRSLFLKDVAIEDFWRYLGWSLVSGGTSGAVSLAVLYPLDFARTRVGADVRSSSDRRFRGSIDCLRQTYRMEGIRGIYLGFDVAVVGIVAWRALYFGCYDTLTTRLLGGRHGGTLGQRWGVAQMVTTTAGTLVYPIDSVRRRMMMEAGRPKPMYQSSVDCARRVWLDEGCRGFYRVSWGKAAAKLQHALFSTYEGELDSAEMASLRVLTNPGLCASVLQSMAAS